MIVRNTPFNKKIEWLRSKKTLHEKIVNSDTANKQV
jgi:hypothetical protein